VKRRSLLVGPPGSGKGTHAKRISSRFKIPHVATGDMLRKEVAAGTELGDAVRDIIQAGGLVPDEMVLDMVAHRLSQPDASRGWLLDGFPRTIPQAMALDDQMGARCIDLVLTLEVPETEIVERISGRRSCPQGHVFHVHADPPRQQGVCDFDGEPLFQREDDRPEVVRSRLEVYARETEPLLEHYRSSGRLVQVDGSGSPEQVYARVEEVFLDRTEA
jgi:adenylate kinase